MFLAIVDLSPSEIVLTIGIVLVGIDRLAELKGWSRSAKRLREENTDLIRREKALMEEREDLRRVVDELKAQVSHLQGRVEALQKTDQAAVLAAIKIHEENAERRAQEGKAASVEITGLLRDIRDGLAASRA